MTGKVVEDVRILLRDTLDLRKLLLQSLDDVVNKRITPSDARARSWLARSIIDTIRIEVIAAREGLRSYEPVRLIPPPTVDGSAENER